MQSASRSGSPSRRRRAAPAPARPVPVPRERFGEPPSPLRNNRRSQNGVSATQRRERRAVACEQRRVQPSGSRATLEPRRIPLAFGERELTARAARPAARPRRVFDPARVRPCEPSPVAGSGARGRHRPRRRATSRRAVRAHRRSRPQPGRRLHTSLDRLELKAAGEQRDGEQQPLVRLEQVVTPLQSPPASGLPAALLPLRNRRNRSSRRAAIAAGVSAPSRAAASSNASGRPSRRRQMRATSSAFSLWSANPGEAAAARSTKSDTASYSASRCSAGGRSGSGILSDGTRNTTSPATRRGSRLVATIVSCGAARRSVSASAAVAPNRCSQLSRTSSSVRDIRKPTTASTSLRRSGLTSSALATASLTSRVPDRSQLTSAARTRTTAGCTRELSASRVFPTPPVPASVSRCGPAAAPAYRVRALRHLRSIRLVAVGRRDEARVRDVHPRLHRSATRPGASPWRPRAAAAAASGACRILGTAV